MVRFNCQSYAVPTEDKYKVILVFQVIKVKMIITVCETYLMLIVDKLRYFQTCSLQRDFKQKSWWPQIVYLKIKMWCPSIQSLEGKETTQLPKGTRQWTADTHLDKATYKYAVYHTKYLVLFLYMLLSLLSNTAALFCNFGIYPPSLAFLFFRILMDL